MVLKRWLLLTIFWMAVVSPVQAEVDAQIVRTLQLRSTPVDLAVSANGRYIYVLTADAQLQIFKDNGELRDTLPVDPGVDRIQPDPKEDRIYLINSAGSRIQVFDLAFVQKIPVDGSPIKGSSEAAVAVVVFTDFQ